MSNCSTCKSTPAFCVAGLRVVLLDGAKHSFAGTPAEAAALIDAVVGWLVEVLPPSAV